jgi:hypothetical protein
MALPQKREALVSSLALFTSLGTLVCCALPVILVALGAGAVMAGLVSAVPQLVWLSRHKEVVFLVAGVLLLAAFWLRFRNRNSCPADPAQAAVCKRLRTFGGIVLSLSGASYAVAVFFAFVAPRVLS